jgi:hypothetical protein
MNVQFERPANCGLIELACAMLAPDLLSWLLWGLFRLSREQAQETLR